ncbi:MAG: ribonuclease III family protein [Candidatus Bathyarchaeia archaeon]
MKIKSSIKNYGNMTEVLTDHGLASLGDAYVNFVYSVAISARKGAPCGEKVKGSVLAEAIRRTGLREKLPSRMTRHLMADAAEALIAYAWLQGYITIEESITILTSTEDSVEGFSQLLSAIKKRIRLS